MSSSLIAGVYQTNCGKLKRKQRNEDGRLHKRYIGRILMRYTSTVWREEMERVVLESNERNIKQSQHTHILREPMTSKLGWTEVGPAVPDILDGSYMPPDGVEQHLNILLHNFTKI
jgi:hypothetical protein